MNSFRDSLLQVPTLLIAAVFLSIILFLNWVGYRARKRVSAKYPNKELGLGTGEGSLLGLMALLLAFSFNMAATKYETRRQTIVEEANLIRTAILRYSLFPDSVKVLMRPGFKNYVESRIGYFEAGDNPEKIRVSLNEADKQFRMIWNINSLATKDPENRSRADQMTPVLISMNNIVATREAGRVAAVPTLIIVVLLILVFVASYITGFGVKPGNRNALLSVSFALMTTVVLYLVMELSRPRQGTINLSKAEEKIEELRKCFS